jgi:hypothetical protein
VGASIGNMQLGSSVMMVQYFLNDFASNVEHELWFHAIAYFIASSNLENHFGFDTRNGAREGKAHTACLNVQECSPWNLRGFIGDTYERSWSNAYSSTYMNGDAEKTYVGDYLNITGCNNGWRYQQSEPFDFGPQNLTCQADLTWGPETAWGCRRLECYDLTGVPGSIYENFNTK